MDSNTKCGIQGCGQDWSILIVKPNGRQHVDEHLLCDQHGYEYVSSYLSKGPIGVTSGEHRSDIICCEVGLLFFDYKTELRQVYLLQVSGTGALAINVGDVEGTVLYNLIKGVTFFRPATHFVMASIITSLGGLLQDIIVDRFDEKGEYYSATLRIKKGEQLVVLDVRPSDAIALATCSQVPILVVEGLLSVGVQRSAK